MFDQFRMAMYHASSWSARILLLAMAACFPWWYAGADYQSQQTLLWAGVCLAGCTWLAVLSAPKRTGGCTAVSIVMLAFLGLVTLQLVPMPAPVNRYLSGANRFCHWISADHIANGKDDALTEKEMQEANIEAPAWLRADNHNMVSIHPLQTRASLAVMAVAAIVFWSASTLFVGTRWAVALCIVLALSGLLNGFLGVLQSINWGRWTLLKMPSVGTSFATFVSRNSAPPFYASSIGAALALMGIAFRSQKRKRRSEYRLTYPGTSILGRLRNRMEDVFIDLNSLAVTCICVVVFLLLATMATFSRGGIIACSGASLITLSMTLGGRSGVARATTLAVAVGGAVLVALSYFELSDGLVARFSELDRSLASGEEGRLIVWGYTLSALPGYWLTGSGLGTFRFAILPFHVGAPSVWFHHAENLPLEVLLDTGIVGFGLAVYVCYLIGLQLRSQSGMQQETLLLSGAMFATVAIGIHSLVDFSLILPGVFIPYLSLVGAFYGRCRRAELEHARRLALGEAARDARLSFKAESEAEGKSSHQRTKLLLHTSVAALTLLCIAQGWHSLSGFAVAERLRDEFNSYRVLDDEAVAQEATRQSLKANAAEMLSKVSVAEQSFPEHAEVALQAGEIQLYLWRVHAANLEDWGVTPSAVCWAQSNPMMLSSLLRIDDPTRTSAQPLAGVLDALHRDTKGQAFASRSLRNFEGAIAGCPMDARAVWGAINANAGLLNKSAHRSLLEMLLVLGRNNPQVLSKASVTAFQEGQAQEGLRLLKTVVSVWPVFFEAPQYFGAVAAYLSGPQLLELLPEDVIARTRVVRQLSKFPDVSPAVFKSLIDEIHKRLPKAQAYVAEDWMDLAWAADQAGDLPMATQLLERGVSQAIYHFKLRVALAQSYHKEKRVKKAVEELEKYKSLNSMGWVGDEKQQIEELIKNWNAAVDRSQ